MKVGIFVVMAGRQAGGPESYDVGLAGSLAHIDKKNTYRVYCLDKAGPAHFPSGLPHFSAHALRPSWRVISSSITLPWQMNADDIDVMHATFTPPPYSPKPYVFTHHCLSTFVHPEFYPKFTLFRLNALIKQGLRKAERIICVSESVRQLTAEHLKVPLSRMTAIHHGVGPNYVATEPALARALIQQKYGITDPYFLYLGKLDARKNIVRLLEAFRGFLNATKDPVKLVLAGRRTPMDQGINDTIKRLQLEDHVVEPGYVALEDLPVMYSGAAMYVFPSLWEGFGIPVIEAMACGTPVLTSNISSLPEVAGDAAYLVDPYSTDDIAQGMLTLWRDEGLRHELRERGLARAKLFTWDRCAQQTLSVYQDVAG